MPEWPVHGRLARGRKSMVGRLPGPAGSTLSPVGRTLLEHMFVREAPSSPPTGPPQHWLGTLNDAQRDAVTCEDRTVLVVAGAGTGKTWTLACRVAHLVESGVHPERVLLLTFTRRAAREMLGRAEQLVGRE